MSLRNETEVLVVGAGPVGLVSALVLAERGVRVEIVDEEWQTTSHSYGLAVHPGALAIFDELGLAEPLLRHGRRIDAVGLYDRETRRTGIRYADLGGKHPFLLALPQSALESVLEERLRKQKVKVNWNHEVAALRPGTPATVEVNQMGKVSEGYPIATTEWVVERTNTARADFVIGADGHRSVVRRALEIEYELVGEPELFAVFEFETDDDPGDEMCIVLDGDLSSALWPLPEGRARWSFQIPGTGEPTEPRHKSRLSIQIGRQSFPYLSEEHLHQFIRERAPWFTARPKQINWSMVVRFERRLARKFGRDNIWLTGDAAHLTGPVGIQSMNVGFREARDLALRIHDVLRGKASRDALPAYEAERQAEWKRLLGLDATLSIDSAGDRWLAPYGARLVACIPESGDRLEKLGAQIGLRFTAR